MDRAKLFNIFNRKNYKTLSPPERVISETTESLDLAETLGEYQSGTPRLYLDTETGLSLINQSITQRDEVDTVEGLFKVAEKNQARTNFQHQVRAQKVDSLLKRGKRATLAAPLTFDQYQANLRSAPSLEEYRQYLEAEDRLASLELLSNLTDMEEDHTQDLMDLRERVEDANKKVEESSETNLVPPSKTSELSTIDEFTADENEGSETHSQEQKQVGAGGTMPIDRDQQLKSMLSRRDMINQAIDLEHKKLGVEASATSSEPRLLGPRADFRLIVPEPPVSKPKTHVSFSVEPSSSAEGSSMSSPADDERSVPSRCGPACIQQAIGKLSRDFARAFDSMGHTLNTLAIEVNSLGSQMNTMATDIKKIEGTLKALGARVGGLGDSNNALAASLTLLEGKHSKIDAGITNLIQDTVAMYGYLSLAIGNVGVKEPEKVGDGQAPLKVPEVVKLDTSTSKPTAGELLTPKIPESIKEKIRNDFLSMTPEAQAYYNQAVEDYNKNFSQTKIPGMIAELYAICMCLGGFGKYIPTLGPAYERISPKEFVEADQNPTFTTISKVGRQMIAANTNETHKSVSVAPGQALYTGLLGVKTPNSPSGEASTVDSLKPPILKSSTGYASFLPAPKVIPTPMIASTTGSVVNRAPPLSLAELQKGSGY